MRGVGFVSGGSVSGQWVTYSSNGEVHSRRHVLMNFPVLDVDGEFVGFILSFTGLSPGSGAL